MSCKVHARYNFPSNQKQNTWKPAHANIKTLSTASSKLIQIGHATGIALIWGPQ